MNDIERAEFIQSLKAYLIPSSLFVACLIGAAGTFLIREGYQLGWAFIAVTGLIIVSAFWAFICFQNKHRYEGRFIDEDKTKSASKKQSAASNVETNDASTNFAPDVQELSAESVTHAENLTSVEK